MVPIKSLQHMWFGLHLQRSICIFLQNNIPESKIDSFGGKVCTFGSYRLGVHTKGMMALHKKGLIIF